MMQLVQFVGFELMMLLGIITPPIIFTSAAPSSPYHTLTATDLPPANLAAARPSPLKGFLTSPEWHSGGYADPQYLNDPSSTLEFYYIGLSDIMTGMAEFPGFDTMVEPRVAASASRGKHAILRVRYLLYLLLSLMHTLQYVIRGCMNTHCIIHMICA